MSKLDVSGIMNKVKSAIDSFTGPGHSAATEETLANETDPTKIKLLEVELLIAQLHDLIIIQTKAITDLKNKYAEVKKLTSSLSVTEAPTTQPTSTESQAQSEKPKDPMQ